MLNLMTVLAQEGHHVVNELPIPTWAYGGAVFAILMFLLLATLSLRSVSLRYEAPSTTVAHRGSEDSRESRR